MRGSSSLKGCFVATREFRSLGNFTMSKRSVVIDYTKAVNRAFILPRLPAPNVVGRTLVLVHLFGHSVRGFCLVCFSFVLGRRTCGTDGNATVGGVPPFSILGGFFVPVPPITRRREVVTRIGE